MEFLNHISLTDGLLIVIVILIAYIGNKVIEHLADISEGVHKTDAEKDKENFEMEHPEALL